jgi:hypothetical protein
MSWRIEFICHNQRQIFLLDDIVIADSRLNNMFDILPPPFHVDSQGRYTAEVEGLDNHVSRRRRANPFEGPMAAASQDRDLRPETGVHARDGAET